MSYAYLKKQIEDGKVVQHNGRSAATVAELESIMDLPDGSASLDVTTIDHGAQEEVTALQAQDTIGGRAQPFSPEVVAANKPSANEPGPTTINTPDPKPDARKPDPKK